MASSKLNFGEVNPKVATLYFACAVCMSVLANELVFQVASLVCAAVLYVVCTRRAALKFLGGMLVLFALVSLVNPVLSSQGQTVLFYMFGAKVYTLEALADGVQMAAMLVGVILWLACFSHLVDFAGQMQLLGVKSSVALVLTMCMRFIPNLQIRVARLFEGQKCLGAHESESTSLKIKQSSGVLAALAGWAFEDAMVTSDSMTARGFLCSCGRTSVRPRVMRAKDWLLLAAAAVGAGAFFAYMFVLSAGAGGVLGVGAAAGGVQDIACVAMLSLCTIYMLCFSGVILWEEIRWRMYFSKM